MVGSCWDRMAEVKESLLSWCVYNDNQPLGMYYILRSWCQRINGSLLSMCHVAPCRP
jgi:hypothetical protein